MSLSSSQSNLNAGDEFNVDVNFSISSADGTSYYLRGEFYKEGTSSYCGYTWNGNNWYNGPYSNNGWEQLRPITIYQSSWSGQLKAKIDPSDSGCQSSGDYKFKILRYTSSGSSSSDDQNVLTVNLTIPTPTPTITPTPTSIKTPTPTPTTKTTPTPTPTPIKSGFTPTPTKTSSAKDSNVQVIRGDGGQVLGASSGGSTLTPTPTSPEVLIKGESTSTFFSPVTYIIGGLGILTAACGILLFRQWRKQRESDI